MSKRLEEEERKRKYFENVNMIMDGNSSDIEQLGEDDEDDDEDWSPQAMHDEQNSESSDEENCRDQSIAQSNMEVEVPTTILDTVRNESVKAKVKRKEYKWRKTQYQAPSVDFIASVEEGTENRCDMTPYMYFKQFVTDEMLLGIAEQTNMYSVQKEGKSINTSAKEMEQVHVHVYGACSDALRESLLGDGNKASCCL
ncbi:hypothetical protein CRENBAI_000112 [Crenichthys baileyi]|uniref:PiggyBac transposable element-derived protein domain-containing protein n=1 Tax=Crenichthys baileyi TaxID=28760 RepID=A0AAV9R048_9TELE